VVAEEGRRLLIFKPLIFANGDIMPEFTDLQGCVVFRGCWRRVWALRLLQRIEQAAELAVAVGEEPGGDGGGHEPKKQKFVTDHHGGQDNEGETTGGNGSAGCYASDDYFKRRPKS